MYQIVHKFIGKNKLLFILGSTFLYGDTEFTVSKNGSKNELKEEIGECIKTAIDNCSSVTEQVGNLLSVFSKNSVYTEDIFKETNSVNKTASDMLKILGGSQKKFSDTAKALIENRSPFKRAKKYALENTLAKTRDLNKKLEERNRFLATLSNSVSKELSRKELSSKDQSSKDQSCQDQSCQDAVKTLRVIKIASNDLKSQMNIFEDINRLVCKVVSISRPALS